MARIALSHNLRPWSEHWQQKLILAGMAIVAVAMALFMPILKKVVPALQGLGEQGVQARVSDYPVRTVLIPWSAIARAERVVGEAPRQDLDPYDVGLWLRNSVEPFHADALSAQPHVRLLPGLEVVSSHQLLQAVQDHLAPLPAGATASATRLPSRS